MWGKVIYGHHNMFALPEQLKYENIITVIFGQQSHLVILSKEKQWTQSSAYRYFLATLLIAANSFVS